MLPRILQCLPGGMRFEAGASTSVELCVSEWVSGSAFRDQTTILAEPGNKPLIDAHIVRRGPVKRFTSLDMALTVRRLVKRHGYNLIVSQQHISTAARMALLNPGVPVILQTHNFVESPGSGGAGWLKRRQRQWEFGRLAGITLISDATLRQFESDWPGVAIPRRVVSNGFDFSTWTPSRERQKTVLVVGRCSEAKGILEAAEGIADVLSELHDWKALFILSEPERSREYFNAVSQALRPCGNRAQILTGMPYGDVKRFTESAAISVAASKWVEPFGRTALEAHAGGAALISSGTGGLREISGDAAYYLAAVNRSEIAAAFRMLATNEDLRASLAQSGSRRVRQRFSLASSSQYGADTHPPVCRQLDNFYRDTVEFWSARVNCEVSFTASDA